MKKTILVKARTLANASTIASLESKKKTLKRDFGVKVFPHFETDKAHEIYAWYKRKIDGIDADIIAKQEENKKYEQGVTEVKHNRIFGVELKSQWLPSTRTSGYEAKIPNVLLDLKDVIVKNNGFRTPGIFRIAPDKVERDDAKAKINRGVPVAKATKNVHVAASLIMVWFREIPTPILEVIGRERVLFSFQKVDTVSREHELLIQPQRSIITWLWDFLVEVADHSEFNKMDIKNLAIIVAPCMFNHKDFPHPMAARDFSQHVVSFCARAMEWRKAESKEENKEETSYKRISKII